MPSPSPPRSRPGPRSRSRSRTLSPARPLSPKPHDRPPHSYRRRSPPSPSHPHPHHHRHHHHRRHYHHRPSEQHKPAPTPVVLPCNAGPLSKADFIRNRPLFALYLDIQKGLFIDELTDDEARGRWKSFVGKWNRAELSEGWYEPHTRARADAAALAADEESAIREETRRHGRASPVYNADDAPPQSSRQDDDDDDDDDVGPHLPSLQPSSSRAYGDDRAPGPTIPRTDDLQLQRETQRADDDFARSDLRFARRQDRLQQQTRLDELVPRADAGTRERQLEKKADVRAFHADRAAASGGGGGAVEEVPDGELLGDDGVEGLRRKKGEWERKKNERELRKEEMLRARREERAERLREGREKEERVMSGLRALARERFG